MHSYFWPENIYTSFKLQTVLNKADTKFRFTHDLPIRKYMPGKSPHKVSELRTQTEVVLVWVTDT